MNISSDSPFRKHYYSMLWASRKYVHSKFISFGKDRRYIFFFLVIGRIHPRGSSGYVKVGSANSGKTGTSYRSTGWRISFILPWVLLKGIHSYHRYVLPFIAPLGIFRSENRRNGWDGYSFLPLRSQCLIFSLTSTFDPQIKLFNFSRWNFVYKFYYTSETNHYIIFSISNWIHEFFSIISTLILLEFLLYKIIIIKVLCASIMEIVFNDGV